MKHDENYDHDLGKIRLSFIDVIYGVVIAYGFNFVDKMKHPFQYALFFLAFIAIVFDWVFVHQPYWKKIDSYKNVVLVIDLVILFLFSRIFATSASYSFVILIPFSLLFLFYSIWDYVFRKQLKNIGRFWLRDFLSDLAMCLLFSIMWLLLTLDTQPSPLYTKIFYDIPLWVGVIYIGYAMYFAFTFEWIKNSHN